MAMFRKCIYKNISALTSTCSVQKIYILVWGWNASKKYSLKTWLLSWIVRYVLVKFLSGGKVGEKSCTLQCGFQLSSLREADEVCVSEMLNVITLTVNMKWLESYLLMKLSASNLPHWVCIIQLSAEPGSHTDECLWHCPFIIYENKRSWSLEDTRVILK